MTRLNRVRRELRSRGLDSLLIFNPLNIRYLTGYTPTAVRSLDISGLVQGAGAVVLLSKRNVKLFVAKLDREQASKDAKDCEIISDHGRPLLQSVQLSLSKRTRVLGYETGLTLTLYKQLKRLAKGITLRPVENVVEEMRIVKHEEVRFMKKSARITSQVFKEILPLIRPGVRELDLALEIEYRFRKRGADGFAFPPIVASGANSALPHASAGRRKFRKGDLLVIDLGGYYKGYASDMTRTAVIGRATDKQRKVYAAVKEAYDTAMKKVKAGVACSELDKSARDIIGKWGFRQRFIHSLGHGVGLAVHELPFLSTKSSWVLRPGMIVTIEPGVYLPRWGGVRIEDTVLIGRDRPEVLTTAKKRLLEL
jgi:Xaa-Pro aminopeptidase